MALRLSPLNNNCSSSLPSSTPEIHLREMMDARVKAPRMTNKTSAPAKAHGLPLLQSEAEVHRLVI
jgi:hypothetical protein